MYDFIFHHQCLIPFCWFLEEFGQTGGKFWQIEGFRLKAQGLGFNGSMAGSKNGDHILVLQF